MPLDGGPAQRLFSAPRFQYAAEISPDGRWLAYASDESGRYEIYVRRLPISGGKWQVSTNGGGEPHWGPDGRALYYRHRRDLVRVPVETRDIFIAGPPERVVSGQIEGNNPQSYDIAPDGRIVFLQMLGGGEASQPVLILGFADKLRRR